MLLGYTLLGLVPKFKTGSDSGATTFLAGRIGQANGSAYIPALDRDQPMVSAAFQMLQANLKLPVQILLTELLLSQVQSQKKVSQRSQQI
jgi:hypothetical protein